MNGCQESLTLEDAPTVNPIISTGQKKCSKCGKIKKISDFYTQGLKPRSWCKLCINENGKQWKAKNAAKIRETMTYIFQRILLKEGCSILLNKRFQSNFEGGAIKNYYLGD